MKSKNDFITDCNRVHGNKYDYSLVEYEHSHKKVKIICPIHGVFEQTPTNHISGKNGCRKCSGNDRKDKQKFIFESNKIHNNKYDYTLIEYVNRNKKVKIICPVHGIFEQIPKNHLNGFGCSKCTGNNKKSTKEFIEISKKLFGEKFDYTLTEYLGMSYKVKLICKEHNFIFEINAHNHLYHKFSCPLCNNKSIRLRRLEKIKENKLKGHPLMPVFNLKACEYFDGIMKKENINIQHALNGGEYYIKELGYWLDGYDLKNNTVYEYYEKHHFTKNGLRKKDIIRENEIKNFLKCKFIPIIAN